MWVEKLLEPDSTSPGSINAAEIHGKGVVFSSVFGEKYGLRMIIRTKPQ